MLLDSVISSGCLRKFDTKGGANQAGVIRLMGIDDGRTVKIRMLHSLARSLRNTGLVSVGGVGGGAKIEGGQIALKHTS